MIQGLDASVDTHVHRWAWSAAQNGGVVTLRTLNAYNRLIKGLKSRGLWGKIVRLNGFAGGNMAAACVPMVAGVGTTLDTNHSFVDADYAEATGPITDGTTKYLDTGWSPNAATLGMFMYLRTDQATSGSRIPMGCRNSASTQLYRFFSNAGTQTLACGGNVLASTGSQMTAGSYHMERRSTTDMVVYKNGVLQSQPIGTATVADPSASITVFAHNGAGTVGSWASANTAIGGYSLDDGTMLAADLIDYHHLWQAFETALGRNV